MVIDIKHFIEVNVFKKQLQDIVDRLRGLPTIEQDNSVMVPGDPEKKCYDIRIKEGIPIDEIKYEEFLATSSMFKEVIE
jgi:LDH2 family malate/lactate/ureidoglycolate dehydrogenase